MATVLIPALFRKHTAGQDQIDLPGDPLQTLLQNFIKHFPPLGEYILTDQGELVTFLSIFINDQDVRLLQKLQTPVKPADRITLIPAIAGG